MEEGRRARGTRWEPGGLHSASRGLSCLRLDRLARDRQVPLPLPASLRRLPSDFRVPSFRRPPAARARMLPKRRRAWVGSPGGPAPSTARFPGIAIYLAEPRMGRSRRAFLTRLALSKGFRVLDAYRCAVVDELVAQSSTCRGLLPGTPCGAGGTCPRAPARGAFGGAGPGIPRGPSFWRLLLWDAWGMAPARGALVGGVAGGARGGCGAYSGQSVACVGIAILSRPEDTAAWCEGLSTNC